MAPRPAIAAVAGFLAAGAALATGELVGAITGQPPSLVTAVGDELIDRYAASLKDFAVSVFGTNHKLALIVGIIVVSLALGAGFGLVARRRFWLAAAGISAFGVVGLTAGLRDPQGSAGTAWASSLTAIAAGIGTLRVLFWVARSGAPAQKPHEAGKPDGTGEAETAGIPAEDPRNPAASRRSFIAWGSGVGTWAIFAGTIARTMRLTSTVESERAAIQLPSPTSTTSVPANQPFDVPGLSPYIVPNKDFYRIDTALRVPQVEAASWSLSVEGKVDRPFQLTHDELLAMDMVEAPVTLTCVSNEVGGDLVGNAHWLGVPLTDLLDRAGVQPDGTQIVGESVDGFTAGFPTELAYDGRTALVAVGMNGEPLPTGHGYPARLVVSGLYGFVSATKWLRRIRLEGWEEFDGYWIPRGWAKEAPIKIASRIDVPGNGASVSPGPTPVAGVAWSPSVGISKVAVRVDDGPWEEARLGTAASDDTWVQWVYEWEATPGEHRLQVRAADDEGQVQTGDRRPPAPDGATGWHARTVFVDN